MILKGLALYPSDVPTVEETLQKFQKMCQRKGINFLYRHEYTSQAANVSLWVLAAPTEEVWRNLLQDALEGKLAMACKNNYSIRTSLLASPVN